jgi:aconitate hydratase
LDDESIRELAVGGLSLKYCDINVAAGKLGRSLEVLPYATRVLFENVCRSHALGGETAAGLADLQAVLDPTENPRIGVPLHVSRIILPDSSGIPILLDLAALRSEVAEAGLDPQKVQPRLPVDLIVDHSLQVDFSGSATAAGRNMAREIERNAERYRFLKWARSAFTSLRIFPPGSGIIHQINLEHLATVVTTAQTPLGRMAFPDFVMGADSHTPMVNSLGVLGWGVGGLDAEAAILGRSYTFPVPEIVGVELVGELPSGTMTTDLALLITQRLRESGVTGKMVEFHGAAAARLSVPERGTLANMAPEYGATCGFFPVDLQTLNYLRASGRSARQIRLVERYCRVNGLFREPGSRTPAYGQSMRIDLSRVRVSVAGPRRPEDRLDLGDIKDDFRRRLRLPVGAGGFGAGTDEDEACTAVESASGSMPGHGSLVIAAITSCANTSNPAVMMAAGLVAQKAVALGLKVPWWVKTSLAPGSRLVVRYLKSAGLMIALEALGFYVVGYGCTTCGGKSGPLQPGVSQLVEQRDLVAATILSGNRNFEGRIHRQARANYICSPPLVVAYALAGRIDVDLAAEPLGVSFGGAPVFLRDLWPSPEEISDVVSSSLTPQAFRDIYTGSDEGSASWSQLPAPTGSTFDWDAASHYLVRPPFFGSNRTAEVIGNDLLGARALAAFGDSITTDHISPGGEIPSFSPAGRYLLDAGIPAEDFNTYVARRCNHEVMARATFANIRIKNLLLPDIEGGMTRYFPQDEKMWIYEAANRYCRAGVPVIVLAGKNYGVGSSRDWAAKGSSLLGVKAVIAESFERIHRANLVGMGIVPFRFQSGEGWRQLGLSGDEIFDIVGLRESVIQGRPALITAKRGERLVEFNVMAVLLTDAEKQLLLGGGMLRSILRDHLGSGPRAPAPLPISSHA